MYRYVANLVSYPRRLYSRRCG